MAIVIAPEPNPVEIRKRRRARYALLQLGGWGGAAALALAIVAITSRTETGSQRLQIALANATEPGRTSAVAQVPPRSVENEAETQRLAAQLADQVRALAANRERLTARIATLERNLDDMTGTVKQQAAQTPAPAVTPAVNSAAPPVSSAPPVLAPIAMPVPAQNVAPWNDTPQPQAATVPSEPVPLPPIRMAAAPTSVIEPSSKNEFGVDLGGADNVDALRVHWAAVKANFGPLLVGLRPVASQHQRQPGLVVYRLVVGPLPDAAAATQLCARFAARTACRPAKFAGELLVLP
jgi:hypothetical protein